MRNYIDLNKGFNWDIEIEMTKDITFSDLKQTQIFIKHGEPLKIESVHMKLADDISYSFDNQESGGIAPNTRVVPLECKIVILGILK